jgi:DNA-binding MarR family transcriptional regulator
MNHNLTSTKRNLKNVNKVYYVIFGILFIFFLMILFSQRATAAPPIAMIEDNAPPYINESSGPICILSLSLTDDDGAVLENITVTLENVTGGFTPNQDLAPLGSDNSSGIMIYEETNFIPGFQPDDYILGLTPTTWFGPGPWTTSFWGINKTLPISTISSNYYVVIRTSASIMNDMKFMVGIQEFNIMTDQGGVPLSANWSKVITVDTLSPFPTTSAQSPDPIASVGDWLNITTSILGDDATSVIIDLSEFNGLSSSETMTYDFGNNVWYFNITNLLEGSVDTDWFGYPFSVSAIDKAGKNASNINLTLPVDTKSPDFEVYITQENTPAAIGHWINITVTSDPDTQNVTGDLSIFSGMGAFEGFLFAGGMWYHNFTVSQGALDGFGQINVTVFDDGGNSNYNGSTAAIVDETLPVLDVIILQESIPAGVGKWINITVTADLDVMFMEVDLATAGFTNQIDKQSLVNLGGGLWYYNFTISQGSFEGSNTLFVSALDDLGQFGSNGTQSAQWDEVVPQMTVTITQETTPAKIGSWVLITVTTDSDVSSVIGNLFEFSGQGTVQNFSGFGSNWLYNFTVSEGALDGMGAVIVTVMDNAGNLKINNTESVEVDEIAPTLNVIINSESQPAKIGQWVNITATSDSDVTQVYADLSSAGFSGQIDNQILIWSGSLWYYEFNIAKGLFDGTNTVYVFAVDDVGNVGSKNSVNISWDEIVPTSTITITHESSPAGIGDWINISVISELDVSQITVDLAQAGFSNQMDNQALIQMDSTTWYYLFTISAGDTDASSGIFVNVDVTDDAGNAISESHAVYFDEIYPEPVSVNVITSVSGFNPTKVGDWINITVDVGGNSDIVSMWVDAPGLFTSMPITLNYGSIWYLNTTISEGTVDGLVNFVITAIDDANNINNSKYDSIELDNIYPEPLDIILSHEGNETQYGYAFRITVDIGDHMDVDSVYVEAPGVLNPTPIAGFSDKNWSVLFTGDTQFAWGEVEFTFTITDDAHNVVIVTKTTDFNNLPPPPVRISPDEGIPLGLIIIVACAAAIGTGGVVVAGTEIGHYSLFFIFYLLYTRLKKEYILDNFTRGRIYGYVEANPGEHFNAIKRALSLKNGSLAYHLRTLEKGGYIVSKRDRGYTRFYPKSMKLPKKNVKELIPMQKNIFEIIQSNPGISQRGIADKLKISYQLVHYHIKVLQDADYLYLKKDKKQTYCYDSDESAEVKGVT